MPRLTALEQQEHDDRCKGTNPAQSECECTCPECWDDRKGECICPPCPAPGDHEHNT